MKRNQIENQHSGVKDLYCEMQQVNFAERALLNTAAASKLNGMHTILLSILYSITHCVRAECERATAHVLLHNILSLNAKSFSTCDFLRCCGAAAVNYYIGIGSNENLIYFKVFFT